MIHTDDHAPWRLTSVEAELFGSGCADPLEDWHCGWCDAPMTAQADHPTEGEALTCTSCGRVFGLTTEGWVMTACSFCNFEMTTATGCSVSTFADFGDDVVYARVRYEPDDDRCCHDCNVAPGQFHHPGCDDELCPRCGGQAIGCGCRIQDEDEKDEEER